jgi:hypothetical protein
MPLAIIGNEYSDAWVEVTQTLAPQKKSEMMKSHIKIITLYRRLVYRESSSVATKKSLEYVTRTDEPTDENIDFTWDNKKLIHARLIECHAKVLHVMADIELYEAIGNDFNVFMLLNLSQLQSWLSRYLFYLKIAIKNGMDEIDRDTELVAEAEQEFKEEEESDMVAYDKDIVTVIPSFACHYPHDKKAIDNEWDENLDSLFVSKKPNEEEKDDIDTATDRKSAHADDNDEDNEAIHIRKPHRVAWADEAATSGTKRSAENKRTETMMMKCCKFCSRFWNVPMPTASTMTFTATDEWDFRSFLLRLSENTNVATFLRFFFIIIMFVDVGLLFSESMLQFTQYGESSARCGAALKAYCDDKDDPYRDPGCYVQSLTGLTLQKLKYDCNGDDCFGRGYNFGSKDAVVSCSSLTMEGLLPFQLKDALQYHYGKPKFYYTIWRRSLMTPLCFRVECIKNEIDMDGNPFWLFLEVVVAMIFTSQLIIRAYVAKSLREFIGNSFNILDILGTLPFYLSLYEAGNIRDINFSILATSRVETLHVGYRALKVSIIHHLLINSMCIND